MLIGRQDVFHTEDQAGIENLSLTLLVVAVLAKLLETFIDTRY
jgi:hypothetical protein